ncbi:MAG: hypothetical protein ABSB33_03420, partial [Tepidisphaeraceae bacterium]
MSENTPRKIVCTACGRTARYRPELAGKQVRCKCGHIISVPNLPAGPHGADDSLEPLRPEPLAADGASDELYEIREEPKPTKPRGIAASGAAQSSVDDDSPLPRAPAPNMYPTSSRGKAPDAGDEKSGLLRWAMVIVILGAVIVGAIVGIRKFGGSHRPAGPQLGEDADI